MIALTIDVTLRQQSFELQVRDTSSVEVLGLFGPSGSGKTSLLEAIAGIRTPDAGEIRVGDRVLFSSAVRINLPAIKDADFCAEMDRDLDRLVREARRARDAVDAYVLGKIRKA